MPESCFHCGESIPSGFSATIEINKKQEKFCCYGCMAVAEMIVNDGLDNFYKHRSQPSLKPEDFSESQKTELILYDDPLIQEEFVYSLENGNKETYLSISGITCAACIWLLEQEIKRIPGIVDFSINHSTHKAHIVWQDDVTVLSTTLLKVREIGYKAKPFRHQEAKLTAQHEKRLSMFRVAVAGIASMQNMMFSIPLYLGMYNELDNHLLSLFRWVSMLMAAPVVLFAAMPFYKAALRSLKAKQLGMDIPVSIAIIIAYLASCFTTMFTSPSVDADVYFDSVSMFAFFLLLGRFVEMQTRHKYLNDEAEFDELMPETATRIVGNKEESVVAHRLCIGDLLLVKQGEVAAADGFIVSGKSHFDESALSGEYLPVNKSVGDKVHGGTSNIEANITVEICAIPKESRVASIVRLLQRAQSNKPHTQQLADRVASYFVAFVLVATSLSGIYWYNVNADLAFAIVLSVLVVTCPCALSLATPTALTAVTSFLRKHGFLSTKGHTLEAFYSATDLIFDKTGTLTKGQLSVQRILCEPEISEAQALCIAAALEVDSAHPIAHAFNDYFKTKASDVSNVIGSGVTGCFQGSTYFLGSAKYIATQIGHHKHLKQSANGPSVFLATDTRLLAHFELSDSLREDAADCVTTLQQSGLNIHILSGDHATAVSQIAHQLNISNYAAEQSPEQKLAYVSNLQKHGANVVMVGDGINDLPVLSQARLSIAMNNASDLTKLNSDALILSDSLQALSLAFHCSRKTRKIIQQNMIWAFSYNLLMLPLAASGFVPPYFAALGMSLSSLLVVFNSLRLRRA
jgi:Cu2+-exporting ATPase